MEIVATRLYQFIYFRSVFLYDNDSLNFRRAKMEAVHSSELVKTKKRNRRPGKGERNRHKIQKQESEGSEEATQSKDSKSNAPAEAQSQHLRPSKQDSSAKSTKHTNNALSSVSVQPKYNFITDYNDHFETPAVAYKDLKPFISLMGAAGTESIIYDPYFCQGRMREYLNDLGCSNIINENTDFYKNVTKNAIPAHDMLITNPPYSGDHKQRLLQYLLSAQVMKPFALLLPAYTATKSYWGEFVDKMRSGRSSGFLYVMPTGSYEYDHPEGTGKDIPPFYSCWFLGGISPSLVPRLESALHGTNVKAVLRDVDAMIAAGYVTSKRPNPKRRKKMAGAKTAE